MKQITQYLTSPLLRNTLLFAFGWYFLVIAMDQQSDKWFDEVKYEVTDKAMYQKKASKGQVYDDAFLQLQNNEWVSVSTIDYMNTDINDNYSRFERRDDNYRAIIAWIGVILLLTWSIIAAIYMTIQVNN